MEATIAVVGDVRSASLPTARKSTPAVPHVKPIISALAVATWSGAYSCAVTTATGRFAFTSAPTSAVSG
jgi:hypothetical protein